MGNRKNKGMKRGSVYHANYVMHQQEGKRLAHEIIRMEGTIKGQEDIIIALGRMGWGPKRLERLSEVLGEVVHEYQALAKEDKSDDPDIDYTVGKYDAELQRCLGPHFLPWAERYNLSGYTEGLRVIELSKRKKAALEEANNGDKKQSTT